MHRWQRFTLMLAGAALMVVTAIPATADHKTFPSTNNMHALGHSFNRTPFPGPINSDIAFWGDMAFNGSYDGFRIVDISAPGNPKLVNWTRCEGDQGDVVVWDDVLVRSWNSPAPAGRFCDGEPVPTGWEGVHVFNISDLNNPELVASVRLDCGSHTTTAVPDLENDRLVVYSNVSSGSGPFAPLCDAIDIVEVPLSAPSTSSFIGKVPLMPGTLGSNNGCHDAGAILGDVNLLACASGHATNVFSIGAPRGGTLENPRWLYNIEEQDGQGNKVGIGGRWHSASFTWDGEVIILGWEPGGGLQAECEATDPDIKKSAFFYDAATGAKLGQWTLPRPQGRDENCTIHNYNIVPTNDGRDVFVVGNYQAGTWVVDFSDPANATTLGWADPPSLGPGPFCSQTTPPGCQLGGDWSTYWYDGFIYESDITRGLAVWNYSGNELAADLNVDHLNPQTQEFSL